MLSNPRPLKVVCLDAALGGRPLRQQPLEHIAQNPDDAAVFPDLDSELHGLVLGVPVGVFGEGEEQRRLRSLKATAAAQRVRCSRAESLCRVSKFRHRARINDRPPIPVE